MSRVAPVVAACTLTACFSLSTSTDDLAGGAAPAPPASNGPLEKRYTEHLGRLVRTPSSPLPPGLVGVDLGVSFPVSGKLAFLFGDNWQQDDDSVGFAPLAFSGTPPKPPMIDWLTGPGGAFVPLRAGSIDLGRMNVPVEGLVAAGKTYVFFATRWDPGARRYGGSVLAHGTGADFADLVIDFDAPAPKLINVSVVQEGGTAFVFGSGADYRKSPVYLARVPADAIADRTRWEYFTGAGFAKGEESARPVVDHGCVGELSVRKHARLGLYVMAYNCDAPRGILVRTATSPAGPWSAPIDVMDSSYADAGYARSMHLARGDVGYDDGLSESLARVDEFGGEYGPYLVPEWFDAEETPPGTFAIVYAMSTWNPYSVSVMRTVLGAPGTVAAPANAGLGLARAVLVNGDFASGDTRGWTQTGDAFEVFIGPDGVHRVTTSTAEKKDAAVGTLSQEFVVDGDTARLAFAIHGGDASVKLMRGAEILRTSWGYRDNADHKVVWSLEEFRGDRLRLLIDDSLTTPWGFVGATAFKLE